MPTPFAPFIHRCRPLGRVAVAWLVLLPGPCATIVAGQPTVAPGAALAVPPVFLGGIADGAPTAEPLALTIDAAIARGLAHNLGAALGAASVETARARRLTALSDLLPHVAARGSTTRQKINLAAFGFSAPGVPPVVGPFDVFDGRVAVSQSLLDLGALQDLRGQQAAFSAALDDERDAKRLVALAVTTLYLQAVASASRIEAGRAQLETAQTLHRLATDLRAAGIVAGIDVLRAQVQLEATEQRQIALENASARDRLALARAIGLPVGQVFTLQDTMAYRAVPIVTVDEALRRAFENRADLAAADARVQAARELLRAAHSEHLPTLHVDGEYGAIGNTLGTARPTFAVTAAVHVPIFDGLTTRGRIIRADADLQRATAERDDVRSRIGFDVQTALLDLDAADRRVRVATHTVELATTQQTQARDRFQAGVASSLELVQAQEALATANDTYIASLFAHHVAKAALARAVGVTETEFRRAVTGDLP